MRIAALICVTVGLLAASPAARSGENYAFLVGVADYDQKDLKPLQYTRNDVIELRKALVEVGYDDADIVLMHDDPKSFVGRRYLPEAAKIREELRLLLNDLNADDTLIVAFAGHGVQFKGERQSFFCPADASLEDRRTLISVNEIYTALEKCKARQKLLLVDACRDQPQSRASRARQSVDLESVTRPQEESAPEGIVAVFSCAAGEQSFEDNELRHGIFFYHVLQALREGAGNRDAELTLDDLVSFSKKKTQTFARKTFAANQRPQQIGNFTGTWVLRNFTENRRIADTTTRRFDTPDRTTKPEEKPPAFADKKGEKPDSEANLGLASAGELHVPEEKKPAVPFRRPNASVNVTLVNVDLQNSVTFELPPGVGIQRDDGKPQTESLAAGKSRTLQLPGTIRYWNGTSWTDTTIPSDGRIEFGIVQSTDRGAAEWVSHFRPTEPNRAPDTSRPANAQKRPVEVQIKPVELTLKNLDTKHAVTLHHASGPDEPILKLNPGQSMRLTLDGPLKYWDDEWKDLDAKRDGTFEFTNQALAAGTIIWSAQFHSAD